MRDWYARIVLRMIRPALARERRSAAFTTPFRSDPSAPDSEKSPLRPADIQTPPLSRIGLAWRGESLRVVVTPCAAPRDRPCRGPLR